MAYNFFEFSSITSVASVYKYVIMHSFSSYLKNTNDKNLRYSLATPYLKNDNAFFTFPCFFFIDILDRFRQVYTVNLPIFFKLYKI
jgi:hypothetical protein